jgi:hypothetical protein
MKRNEFWKALSGFDFQYTVVVTESSKITHNTSEKVANVGINVFNEEM